MTDDRGIEATIWLVMLWNGSRRKNKKHIQHTCLLQNLSPKGFHKDLLISIPILFIIPPDLGPVFLAQVLIMQV